MVIILAAGLGMFFLWNQTKPVALPAYEDKDRILTDIEMLPAIVEVARSHDQHDWERYILMAKRLKHTELSIIESALREVPERHFDPHYRKSIWDSNVKTMLLLRVCFESPAHEMMPGIHGGFMSLSEANHYILDMNWPIKHRFGWFYLEDSIGGYMGPPYDPESEFKWRLSHCKWRDL